MNKFTKCVIWSIIIIGLVVFLAWVGWQKYKIQTLSSLKLYHPHVCKRFDRVHKFKTPSLNNNFCNQIIIDAEDYGKRVGWTQKRHDYAATTDIPIERVACAKKIRSIIDQEILPTIAKKYNVDKHKLKYIEAFIVKYDALPGRQNKLSKHYDDGTFSFSCLLNNLSDFTGGGTKIYGNVNKAKLKKHNALSGLNSRGQKVPDSCLDSKTYSGSKGEVMVHGAKLFHQGEPILKGRRYLLVGFNKMEDDLIENYFVDDRIQRVFQNNEFTSKINNREDFISHVIKEAKGSLSLLNSKYNIPKIPTGTSSVRYS